MRPEMGMTMAMVDHCIDQRRCSSFRSKVDEDERGRVRKSWHTKTRGLTVEHADVASKLLRYIFFLF